MDLEDIRGVYSVDVDAPRPQNDGYARRSRKQTSSSAVTDRRKPAIGHHQPQRAASSKRQLSDRIQNEREQLFKAISIVECCKYASATLIEVDTIEYMGGVFDVLHDILNSAAGELGCIADAVGAQPVRKNNLA